MENETVKKFQSGTILRLFTPRKIITLGVVWVFAWMATKGELDKTFIQTIVTAVIFHYFGNKSALDVPGQDS